MELQSTIKQVITNTTELRQSATQNPYINSRATTAQLENEKYNYKIFTATWRHDVRRNR